MAWIWIVVAAVVLADLAVLSFVLRRRRAQHAERERAERRSRRSNGPIEY